MEPLRRIGESSPSEDQTLPGRDPLRNAARLRKGPYSASGLSLSASVTCQELARQVAYLKEENRILRDRLPERLVATNQEKRRLLRCGRMLGVQLKELISIVSYQSFRR